MKTTNTIALFAKNFAATCIRRSRKSTRRAVMLLAHAICKKAAMEFGGKTSDFSFGIALSEAWHAIKTENIRHSLAEMVNSQGYVMFDNRQNNITGDRYSWARLNGGFDVRDHHILTIAVATEPMSDAYAAELAAFCATYNVAMPAAGQRVTVAL